MSVAVAGQKSAVFEIKSAHLPLVALLLKTADLAVLADALHQRFGDMPDFFDDDALVIDLSPLPANSGVPDFPALIALLRRHRIAPLAVRGGTPEQTAAAREAGLLPAEDAVSAAPAPAPSQPAARAAPAPQPAPVVVPPSAMVIDRPLRSGQQVYARGRDLVVMAMVNPGAEVIADGHIHVYAPLRGKAMAGARGNADARIFALSLEAELLSIAGIYRTGEVALPPEVHGKPAQVRLLAGDDGDKLVFDAL